MSDRSIAQAKLWYWQRVSAMALALCVVVHLLLIVHAARGGLSAAEILGRTRGSVPFAIFYSFFVVACAVHVPIGLRTIMHEWLALRGRGAGAVAAVFGIAILVMGLRAVYAVTAG